MEKGYIFSKISGVLLFVTLVNSQLPYERLCATRQFENECENLRRGSSQIQCVMVQDAIECAQRITNDTADFGVFSAETTLLLSTMDWPELVVTKELRHRERSSEPVDFESVVIVRGDHRGGIEGLTDKKFCHPGLFYDRTQRWSEYFMKHFERTILNADCDLDGRRTTAEMEASVMARFFGSSCRPGRWSHIDSEDQRLKETYPQLCSLCGTDGACSYIHNSDGSDDHEHRNALMCLRDRGDVTYVSKQAAMNFFNNISPESIESFAYMCPNGTMFPILGNTNPCVWLRQPWGVIISKSAKAISHVAQIQNWVSSMDSSVWLESFNNIISYDNKVVSKVSMLQHPQDYIRGFRDIPIAFDTCVPNYRWCTTSYDEKEKCEMIRRGGVTTGVMPTIDCKEPVESVLICLDDIRNSRADFMGIDSNYGYLARNVYDLQPSLYAETEFDKFASVVILIRQSSEIKSLEDLRNKQVCMPEFGGIASMAFINQLKSSKLVAQSKCDFGKVLGEFFGDSCIPGSLDVLHDPNNTVSQSLCNLCRTSIQGADTARSGDADVLLDDNGEPIEPPASDVEEELTEEDIAFRSINNLRGSCEAGSTNRYYGNRGSLLCLHEVGDVAILETQFLHEHAKDFRLDPMNYKILCRNGSLADRAGFQVDEGCLLTTIIDGEIVVRKNNGNRTGITNVMISLDRYFLRDPQFKIYNIYAGQKNLLFKDSTIGLIAADAQQVSEKVQNYVTLFRDVENCNDLAISIKINIFMTFTAVLVAVMFSR